LGRDERQPEADEDALHHVIAHRSCLTKEEPITEEIDAYRADEYRQIRVCSAHMVPLSNERTTALELERPTATI
jgi:hypothetical protein